MTDPRTGGDPIPDPLATGQTTDPAGEVTPSKSRRKPRRDPVAVLNLAMVVYIFVTLLFALPLVIAPVTFFGGVGLDMDVAGRSETVAELLGGLRWVGAVLLAWAISGILVLARPSGKAIFVTAGALQMTFAALAFLYSWSISEYAWDSWYHSLATAILIAATLVMWWARFVGRKAFRGVEPE
jgi:hypothetical protein